MKIDQTISPKPGRTAFLFSAAAAVIFFTIAFAGLRFVHFTNTIEVMLPQEKAISRIFQFFKDSPLADKVAVSFARDEHVPFSVLKETVTNFTRDLDKEYVQRAVTGPDQQGGFGEVSEFLRFAPLLADEQAVASLPQKTSAEYVDSRVKKLYYSLLSPAGGMMHSVLNVDPLGLYENSLSRLRGLLNSSSYDVRIKEGLFVSRDERHALAVLETPVGITDGERAKNLIRYLNERLSALPEGIHATLVAGHRHSISNEMVLKRDIFWTLSAASAAFLMLFLFIFRDARAIYLFLIPMVSVVFAIHLCSRLLGEVSFIIMGMGAVISGIAVDYCIHVYVAMRSAETRSEALREVTKPVVVGALTTCGVFSVFLISNVPGYRELSLFTISSILVSLAFALFILPGLLRRGKTETKRAALQRSTRAFVGDKTVLILWVIISAACAAALPFTHFKTEVRQYDGSSAEVFHDEESFHSIWGGKAAPAMVVTDEPTLDQALERSEQWSAGLEMNPRVDHWASLSQVWPSASRREENRERWNHYWTEERRASFQKTMATAAEKYGFAPDAFNAFLDTLHQDQGAIAEFENLNLTRAIKPRFAFRTQTGIRLIDFFSDTDRGVKEVEQAVGDHPDTLIVSPKSFTRMLSRAMVAEARTLSLAIAFLVPFIAWVFLRRASLVFIALIPVLSSILFIFGAFAVLRVPVNAPTLIALLVVGGLCIDYGVFMVYCEDRILKTDTRLAVMLSAVTTLCGAGALLFARHPVLHSYGLGMVLGVSGGYVSSVFVVPAAYRVFLRRRTEGGRS